MVESRRGARKIPKSNLERAQPAGPRSSSRAPSPESLQASLSTAKPLLSSRIQTPQHGSLQAAHRRCLVLAFQEGGRQEGRQCGPDCPARPGRRGPLPQVSPGPARRERLRGRRGERGKRRRHSCRRAEWERAAKGARLLWRRRRWGWCEGRGRQQEAETQDDDRCVWASWVTQLDRGLVAS
jgi:hypothetical protein